MKPIKILLVDDDMAAGFLTSASMKKNGVNCQIVEAWNGELAMKYLSKMEECPDIILLDINMPVMDGFEFLAAYEQRGKCCGHSKIFMLSSSTRDEDEQTALANKLVQGYFYKPLSASYIQQMLAALEGEK